MPPLISGIIQTCQVSCILHDPYAFFPKLTFTHTHCQILNGSHTLKKEKEFQRKRKKFHVTLASNIFHIHFIV